MEIIGVMPMPPPTSTLCCASAASGKWLRGAPIVSVVPSLSRSKTADEPPREAGSRSTPRR